MRKILQTRIHPVLVFVLIVIAWLIVGLVSATLWNPDADTPTKATVSALESIPVEDGLSATLDQSSLVATTSTPTITGTFLHFLKPHALEILVVKGEVNLPEVITLGEDPTIQSVWHDFTDHGGSMGKNPPGAASGMFVDYISKPLLDGTYTVGIYEYQNIYDDNSYEGDTPHKLLTQDTLRVVGREHSLDTDR